MINLENYSEILGIISENEKNLSADDIIKATNKGTYEVLTIMNEFASIGLLREISDGVYEINKSYLDFHNAKLHRKTIETKTNIEQQRIEKGYIEFDKYFLNNLKIGLFGNLKDFEDINNLDEIDISVLDRKKFDADVCIKIPHLLQKYKGAGEYIKTVIPKLVRILEKSEMFNSGLISKIEVKGIYINITLGDKYLFESLQDVIEQGQQYGESDINKGESIVVDYSSPNAAKHLHAGHIRSTIIGHILSNLYSATGYFTHRVNHINDWGGFGVLIEGYERWKNMLPSEGSDNDRLFFIYTMFRKGEKSSSKEKFNKLNYSDIEELKKFYGDFSNFEEFQKLFEEFYNKTKERFSLLETGNKEEVDLWEKMVSWSLKDFEKFYNILGIKQDYIIGESFYSNMGRNLVLQYEKDGKVNFYTQDLADRDIILLKESLEKGEIEEQQFEILKKEILNDIGSYVVILPNFERFVVLKADGSTIYSTRDLAAIVYRTKVFSPSRIIYEVGQEQGEHFDKLFKSSVQTGIENTEFSHIYHGFYVDADTKLKLSSRDGASNVIKLIEESVKYFESKYSENDRGFSEEEVEEVSHKLAIGSIIFNDIKKDKKGHIGIDKDLNKTFLSFEQSGGAYIIYTICRAENIIKNYGNELPKINSLSFDKLEGIEKLLINEINKYPIIVSKASTEDDPSILADYLLKLSQSYNSYYNAFKVLGGEADYRLIITSSVAQVLKNGMNLCHIDIPERI